MWGKMFKVFFFVLRAMQHRCQFSKFLILAMRLPKIPKISYFFETLISILTSTKIEPNPCRNGQVRWKHMEESSDSSFVENARF